MQEARAFRWAGSQMAFWGQRKPCTSSSLQGQVEEQLAVGPNAAHHSRLSHSCPHIVVRLLGKVEGSWLCFRAQRLLRQARGLLDARQAGSLWLVLQKLPFHLGCAQAQCLWLMGQGVMQDMVQGRLGKLLLLPSKVDPGAPMLPE